MLWISFKMIPLGLWIWNRVSILITNKRLPRGKICSVQNEKNFKLLDVALAADINQDIFNLETSFKTIYRKLPKNRKQCTPLQSFNWLHNLANRQKWPNVFSSFTKTFGHPFCLRSFALPHVHVQYLKSVRWEQAGFPFYTSNQNSWNVNEANNIFAYIRVSSPVLLVQYGPWGSSVCRIIKKCRRLQVQIAPPTDIDHGLQRDEKLFSRNRTIWKLSSSEYIRVYYSWKV